MSGDTELKKKGEKFAQQQKIKDENDKAALDILKKHTECKISEEDAKKIVYQNDESTAIIKQVFSVVRSTKLSDNEINILFNYVLRRIDYVDDYENIKKEAEDTFRPYLSILKEI